MFVSGGIVYSTEHGRMCPACGRSVAECICRQEAPTARGDGIIRISRETKGRKGKTVTVVTGLPLDQKALQRLAAELKRKCGAGGTIRAVSYTHLTLPTN